jgi:hypothetical protein
MYQIVELELDGNTIYIVYNRIKGKELARYDNYHAAFLHIRGL